MHENFYNKDLKHTARDLRNDMTKAEKKLWYEFLNTFKPRVHRQRAIGNYIVDFYIPKASLIIEIDGDSHFIDGAKEKDDIRTSFFKKMNLEIIRFTNNDIYFSFDSVCEKIIQEVEMEIKERVQHTPARFARRPLS